VVRRCGVRCRVPPRKFLLAVEWGLRTALATSLAALLVCEVSAVAGVVGVDGCFLAPVLAVISSTSSITATLKVSYYALWGALVGTLVAWLGAVVGVQLPVPELFLSLYLFLACVLLAYQNWHPAMRKIALVILVVVLLGFVQQPARSLTSPPRALLSIVIGCACSIACSLVPPFRTAARLVGLCCFAVCVCVFLLVHCCVGVLVYMYVCLQMYVTVCESLCVCVPRPCPLSAERNKPLRGGIRIVLSQSIADMLMIHSDLFVSLSFSLSLSLSLFLSLSLSLSLSFSLSLSLSFFRT
jgi:hypothetical protein